MAKNKAHSKSILILHGPNLNLLGEREPDTYGTMTLKELNSNLKKECRRHAIKMHVFQSNHEGELIDLLHAYRKKVTAVVFNPGALTHYSYALRDAVASIQLPTFEVHLSDISKREAFRRVSVVAPVCVKQISGYGWRSYAMAINEIANAKSVRVHMQPPPPLKASVRKSRKEKIQRSHSATPKKGSPNARK